MSLVAYCDHAGREPFATWFARLDEPAAARITAVLARLAQGNLSGLKSVGGGVLERRIDWGPGYRVYLGMDGKRLAVLLGGGTKCRQQQDIVAARRRWADYRARRAQG